MHETASLKFASVSERLIRVLLPLPPVVLSRWGNSTTTRTRRCCPPLVSAAVVWAFCSIRRTCSRSSSVFALAQVMPPCSHGVSAHVESSYKSRTKDHLSSASCGRSFACTVGGTDARSAGEGSCRKIPAVAASGVESNSLSRPRMLWKILRTVGGSVASGGAPPSWVILKAWWSSSAASRWKSSLVVPPLQYT